MQYSILFFILVSVSLLYNITVPSASLIALISQASLSISTKTLVVSLSTASRPHSSSSLSISSLRKCLGDRYCFIFFHLKMKLQFWTPRSPISIKFLLQLLADFLKWNHLGLNCRVIRHGLWPPELCSVTCSHVGDTLWAVAHCLGN